jgi:hypothetical protein
MQIIPRYFSNLTTQFQLYRTSGWIALVAAVLSLASPQAAERPQPTAFLEDFSTDPSLNGWKIHGQPDLFRWEPGRLEVTWDSSKPNSYFYRPIGRTLSRTDDFSLWFDLRLQEIAIGTTPGKPYTFELAVGFLNLAQAIAPEFLRGTGFNSPNLFEFDYFPDSGFGATVAPTIISSNHVFASSFNAPLALNPGDLYRVRMRWDADDEELKVGMTRNGEVFGPIQTVALPPNFTDFAVDHLAIMSYSDAGQDPQFAGSILAHGTVDNLVLTVGRTSTLDWKLTGRFENGRWVIEFQARPEWSYALYRSSDLTSWTLVTTTSAGQSGTVTMTDAETDGARVQFYRLLAQSL